MRSGTSKVSRIGIKPAMYRLDRKCEVARRLIELVMTIGRKVMEKSV
ncbi:MAG: hypothetical protein NXY59_09210 [Aigarchaeota archaeon]|nr:hypothetical protein [Candidatus Pelearchaeum maunauluense]